MAFAQSPALRREPSRSAAPVRIMARSRPRSASALGDERVATCTSRAAARPPLCSGPSTARVAPSERRAAHTSPGQQHPRGAARYPRSAATAQLLAEPVHSAAAARPATRRAASSLDATAAASGPFAEDTRSRARAPVAIDRAAARSSSRACGAAPPPPLSSGNGATQSHQRKQRLAGRSRMHEAGAREHAVLVELDTRSTSTPVSGSMCSASRFCSSSSARSRPGRSPATPVGGRFSSAPPSIHCPTVSIVGAAEIGPELRHAPRDVRNVPQQHLVEQARVAVALDHGGVRRLVVATRERVLVAGDAIAARREGTARMTADAARLDQLLARRPPRSRTFGCGLGHPHPRAGCSRTPKGSPRNTRRRLALGCCSEASQPSSAAASSSRAWSKSAAPRSSATKLPALRRPSPCSPPSR